MNNNLNNKSVFDNMKLSEETETAIKNDFKGITGKLEINLNQGGVRDVTVKIKLK